MLPEREARLLRRFDMAPVIAEGLVLCAVQRQLIARPHGAYGDARRPNRCGQIAGQIARHAQAPMHRAIPTLAQQVDPDYVGGSLLLGVQGVCVIAHGSSGALAIRNAVYRTPDPTLNNPRWYIGDGAI
jgi:hypothetical protein